MRCRHLEGFIHDVFSACRNWDGGLSFVRPMSDRSMEENTGGARAMQLQPLSNSSTVVVSCRKFALTEGKSSWLGSAAVCLRHRRVDGADRLGAISLCGAAVHPSWPLGQLEPGRGLEIKIAPRFNLIDWCIVLPCDEMPQEALLTTPRINY